MGNIRCIIPDAGSACLRQRLIWMTINPHYTSCEMLINGDPKRRVVLLPRDRISDFPCSNRCRKRKDSRVGPVETKEPKPRALLGLKRDQRRKEDNLTNTWRAAVLAVGKGLHTAELHCS